MIPLMTAELKHLENLGKNLTAAHQLHVDLLNLPPLEKISHYFCTLSAVFIPSQASFISCYLICRLERLTHVHSKQLPAKF